VTLRSQNGWPLLERAECVAFEVNGWTGYAANDDVALLADELLTRINDEVESIALGKVRDDWSQAAPRPVRGQTSGYTNHSSATAFDFNALEHGRGSENTWSKNELHEIGLILNSMTDDNGRPIWRWGENYEHSPVDGMHFEINATAEQVRQAAKKLRKKRLAMALVKIDMDDFLGHPMKLSAGAAELFKDDKDFHGTQSLRYLLSWGGARGRRTEMQLNALAVDVAAGRAEVAKARTELAAVKALAAEILRQVTPGGGGK
jgi:hypothetical protein